MNRTKKRLIILSAIIVFIFAIYYVIVNIYQPYLVLTSSMEPEYKMYHLCILEKKQKSFENGDAVYFSSNNKNYIKRIAASQGDTIQIKDKKVYVNNQLSPYFKDTEFDYKGILEEPVTLKTNEFIVLGDNPSASKDSRYEDIGIITADQIKGKIK